MTFTTSTDGSRVFLRVHTPGGNPRLQRVAMQAVEAWADWEEALDEVGPDGDIGDDERAIYSQFVASMERLADEVGA